VATVIVLPALLLSFWLVLQYAVVEHARHVVQAAAQDAAIAAASGSEDPLAVAAGLVSSSAGSITSHVAVTRTSDSNQMTVTVSAHVQQVFPIGSYSVEASASAPIERFIPEPERP
jgi:flagellar basal body L-ring protein FlgH